MKGCFYEESDKLKMWSDVTAFNLKEKLARKHRTPETHHIEKQYADLYENEKGLKIILDEIKSSPILSKGDWAIGTIKAKCLNEEEVSDVMTNKFNIIGYSVTWHASHVNEPVLLLSTPKRRSLLEIFPVQTIIRSTFNPQIRKSIY